MALHARIIGLALLASTNLVFASNEKNASRKVKSRKCKNRLLAERQSPFELEEGCEVETRIAINSLGLDEGDKGTVVGEVYRDRKMLCDFVDVTFGSNSHPVTMYAHQVIRTAEVTVVKTYFIKKLKKEMYGVAYRPQTPVTADEFILDCVAEMMPVFKRKNLSKKKFWGDWWVEKNIVESKEAFWKHYQGWLDNKLSPSPKSSSSTQQLGVIAVNGYVDVKRKDGRWIHAIADLLTFEIKNSVIYVKGEFTDHNTYEIDTRKKSLWETGTKGVAWKAGRVAKEAKLAIQFNPGNAKQAKDADLFKKFMKLHGVKIKKREQIQQKPVKKRARSIESPAEWIFNRLYDGIRQPC